MRRSHYVFVFGILALSWVYACQSQSESLTLTLSLAQRAALVSRAVASPVFRDGQLYGVRLRVHEGTELGWPESWPEKDTIVAVDGRSHPDAQAVLDALGSATEVELTMEAAGRPRRTVRIRFAAQ